MTRSFSLLLGALSLAAIASSSASAEDQYTGRFSKKNHSGTTFLLGMTDSEFTTIHIAQKQQGRTIVDVETYVTANGAVRHDAVWDTPSPDDQELHLNLSLSGFVSLFNSQPNGYRLTEFSSYLLPGSHDDRRYTAVYDWNNGDNLTKALLTNLTWAEFDAATLDQLFTQGRALYEFDSYQAADGGFRYDAVFGPIVGGGLIFGYASTYSSFVTQVLQQGNNGFGVRNFERTMQSVGTELWTTVYYPESPLDQLTFSGGRTTFLLQYDNLFNQGYNLTDFEVLVDVPRPNCENYGTGWSGTNGVPSLTCSAPAALGQTSGLDLGNSRGTNTLAMIQVGTAPASVDSGRGGTFLVNAFESAIFTLGSSGLHIPHDILFHPANAGVELFFQTIMVDPGASHGIAFSKGLKITYGRWE